jgi:hypothetical protein
MLSIKPELTTVLVVVNRLAPLIDRSAPGSLPARFHDIITYGPELERPLDACACARRPSRPSRDRAKVGEETSRKNPACARPKVEKN